MSEGTNLCAAFEQYYSTERPLRYAQQTRVRILQRFENVPYRYAEALFDEVIRAFSGRGKYLPELADIEKVASRMDRPEVYAEPTLALPEPDRGEASQVRDDWRGFLAKLGSSFGIDPEELEKRQGDEINGEERRRVRARALKGNATVYERHWLWSVDENGGQYVNIIAGPFAAEAVTEEVHRHVRASHGGASKG